MNPKDTDCKLIACLMDCLVCIQEELDANVELAQQAVAGLQAQLRQQKEVARGAQLTPTPAQVTLLPSVQLSVLCTFSWFML